MHNWNRIILLSSPIHILYGSLFSVTSNHLSGTWWNVLTQCLMWCRLTRYWWWAMCWFVILRSVKVWSMLIFRSLQTMSTTPTWTTTTTTTIMRTTVIHDLEWLLNNRSWSIVTIWSHVAIRLDTRIRKTTWTPKDMCGIPVCRIWQWSIAVTRKRPSWPPSKVSALALLAFANDYAKFTTKGRIFQNVTGDAKKWTFQISLYTFLTFSKMLVRNRLPLVRD